MTWLPKIPMGQAFSGVAIVAALAVLFFVFYVTPQSQYERDRIYRSMGDVSRLLDDKVQAAAQTFQAWDCTRSAGASGENTDCYSRLSVGLDTIQRDIQRELPGFEFGCLRKNLICLGPAPETLKASIALGRDKTLAGDDAKALQQVSITLDAIAREARLPYPEAILLILSPNGQVIAGHDGDGKWSQFQSLSTLIDRSRVEAGKPASADELSKLLGAAQRSGRGAENSVFEGFPARLSRNIGGQGYSIFMAAHELGRLRSDVVGGKTRVTIQAGNGGAPDKAGAASPGTGTGNEAAGKSAGATATNDLLYFAYIVPDRVIDRAAMRITPGWTVNLLLLLICGLLAIPFLKLFNRNPLKAISVADLAAILISTMLIVTTVTLFLTAVLLRNSVAQEIEAELGHIAGQVSHTVEREANRFGDKDPRLARYVADGKAWVASRAPGTRWSLPAKDGAIALGALAPLQSAFAIGPSGSCAKDAIAGCGEGLWFGQPPLAGQLDISDRAYFKAWRDATPGDGTGKYVQFLRSKANGKLSWSYIVDAPGMAQPGSARRGYVVSAMPLALRAPVLARNFSFMIVLNTDLPDLLKSQGSEFLGDVQYHSEQSRSLIENVLREGRDDPRLAAALWTLRGKAGEDEASGAIPINYHGRNHFALVRPIPDMPLSVVALYDRGEAQGLFAQTMAQTFFLCCCWILICAMVCWATPRIIRLTLAPRRPGDPPRPMLRTRSIWFFPNGLFKHAADGFIYAAQAGLDELLLFVTVLSAQTAAFFLLPAGNAAIAIALFSVAALVGDYMLIARPYRGGLPAAARRILLFLIVLFAGLALYGALTRFAALGVVFLGFLVPAIILIGAYALLIGRLVTSRAARKFWVKLRKRLQPVNRWFPTDRSKDQAIRSAFLLRALIHLLVVVAVPTIGFVTFIYSENLKGYVGASLISAAERIADQRTILRKDIEQRFANSAGLMDGFGLTGVAHEPPGWLLSSPKAPDGSMSGIFSVCLTSCSGSAGGQQPSTRIVDFLDAVTPHYAASSSEARDSAGRVELVRDRRGARWIRLKDPQDFLQPGSRLMTGGAGRPDRLPLEAGPITQFTLHPEAQVWIPTLLFFGLFCFAFRALLRNLAVHLTGLHLLRVEPDPVKRAALDALIAVDPKAAWDKIADPEQRARLLALAYGRTINFYERGPIRTLIEEGYLELTPYVRIANDRLKIYLRYDLPRADREAVLKLSCGSDDDYWDRMRMPVFVGLGAACLLIAYTSPDAIQLVTSAFLALTALLPLAQDPIGRFLGTQKE